MNKFMESISASKEELTPMEQAIDNARRYCYAVIWHEESQAYVGLCAEFQSISHLDANREEAFKGIVDLVLELVTDMVDEGETIPTPICDGHHGTFIINVEKKEAK